MSAGIWCKYWSESLVTSIRKTIKIVIQICLYVYTSSGLDSFSSFYPKFGDIPLLNRKVFGAYRVSIQEHPYIANVQWKLAHYVPAAILSRTTLITTAWPLQNVPVHELYVVGGENYVDRGTKRRTVLYVLIHKDFNATNLDNDIALLRIYEEFMFMPSIKPIVIVPKHYEYNKETGFVTGWGRCDFNGAELCMWRTSAFYPGELIDPMLRTVKFIIKQPEYSCDGYKRQGAPILNNMICLGPSREESKIAPCLGVPGAPLVVNGYLAGLLSWGLGCGYTKDLPLIYTDLREYTDWINLNVRILTEGITNDLLQDMMLTYSACRWFELIGHLNNNKHFSTAQAFEHNEVLPMVADHILAKLNATVYDVRDYYEDRRFRESKARLYEAINKLNSKQVLKMYAYNLTYAVPILT